MIAYTREEIISATDLARNVSSTLSSIVQHSKEKIAIMKNNKLEAVIIDIEEYERLKEAYEFMEHMEIAKIVEERRKTQKDAYINGDEVLQNLGLSLDD
ncbi:MAG: type II toxin-antitoxin system Phd/YefM family antitoxin [Sulfurovum sp.]|nr:type II toxin-antitoxin system Phd/YefM family antitoxin [Sulfurovum sp.]